MSRVIAYRVGIGLLCALAFWLLWSLAYEVVVALRWAPHRFPSDGASRWALFRMQNADRSADFFLVAWRHWFPAFLAFGFGLSTLGAFVVSTTVGLFGVNETWTGWAVWTAAISEAAAIVLGGLLLLRDNPVRSRREAQHHPTAGRADLH